MNAMNAGHIAPARDPFSRLDHAFADYLMATQPSPDDRHRWLAALVSAQFGRGHACLDLETLRQRGVAALGWPDGLNAHLPAQLTEAAASLPWIQGEASPLVLAENRLYLRRNWQAEQDIRQAIVERLTNPCSVPDNLKAVLDALFPPPNAAMAGVDWQKIACALAARGRFTLITGGPGTGKTTTVVRLLALLQSDALSRGAGLRIDLAAPTGKAAARLSESITRSLQSLPAALRQGVPTHAVTLHKLLGVRGQLADENSPALVTDLVIVDEASMIDLEMMARLLIAVPPQARLILLGDKDQLASVEAGAVLGQLCKAAELPRYSCATADWIKSVTGFDLPDALHEAPALAQQTVMLRYSHRFNIESGIGQWAKAINAGDVARVRVLLRETPVWPCPAAGITRIEPPHARDQTLLTLAREGWSDWLDLLRKIENGSCDDSHAQPLLAAFSKFQVLCALREGAWGTVQLNARIAHYLGFPDKGWYIGRPVMVTRNDYGLDLMNGDVGLCLPHARGLRVAFPDSAQGIKWVSPARLEHVEDLFAMTVHKSQGSEFEQIALVLPDQPSAILTRELVYTGITRARVSLHLVIPNPETLVYAASQNVERSGGLADF